MTKLRNLYDGEPFSQIPRQAAEKVEAQSESITYPAETVIFSQSDSPTGFLYFIKSGEVDIVAETSEGVEMIVDRRTPGGFFGWTPIFTKEAYTAGAKTAAETVCLRIPEELISKIAQQFPIISKFFNKAIYSQIRRLYTDMVERKSIDPIAQMEAYPFQKRLHEIMSSPVITCLPTDTVREVAYKMTELGISAIVVCNNDKEMLGIVTERDLVRKVLAKEAEACLKHSTAADIMTTEPYFMPPETYMYEAAAFMLSHSIRHLPIIEGKEIAGIVSIKDLMRFRSQKSMMLVGSANEATTVKELKAIRKELVMVAKVLLVENRSHVETMEILSYIHHSIIRRCFEVVLKSMHNDGYKQPDIKFAFIIMGSGGRKEMLLGPDQDNGFIYGDFPDEMKDEVDAFFIPLAERLVTALDDIGYPLCHGKVMANNPQWRGRLSEWEDRIKSWIQIPEPQRVRYSSIFFDFMPISGDASLCDGLRDIVHKQIRENPLFLFQMMELDFKHKVPLNLLGRFVTHSEKEHKGQLSLKENGSIFIVDCARMFTLERGIHATTTIERLDRLLGMDIFNRATIEHIKAAFETFTYLRLQNEVRLIDAGEEPSHFIDPDNLTEEETDILKEAFKVASKLQDSTKRHFSRIVGR